MVDDQQGAESLDEEKVAPDYPPDRPLGAEDYGTAGAEEQLAETPARRRRREEPDRITKPPRPEVSLATPDSETAAGGQAIAERGEPEDDPVQRTGAGSADRPAEEAAIRETDEGLEA